MALSTDYSPYGMCRLCGRGVCLPHLSRYEDGDLHPRTYLIANVGVPIPDQPIGFRSWLHVDTTCQECAVRIKMINERWPVPFAIYGEQTDYSMRPVKTCPMCGKSGDASIGTFCSSCAGTMYRPSFKERKRMAPLWDEYMQHEAVRECVNSVGALQVLPESAMPLSPTWSYRIQPSGTQPDGTVTWSSHIEYLPQNTYVEAPYTRNAKKGSFKIHGFGA